VKRKEESPDDDWNPDPSEFDAWDPDAEGWSDPEFASLVKGETPEERHNSHQAIEMALLRVRHRHEKAGDAHKYTFGELLKEASKELDEQIDEMKRTGKSKWDDLLKTK
jgi:hypothetical protein